jgi:anaerobic nitric oxide reductase flavorubredoxin
VFPPVLDVLNHAVLKFIHNKKAVMFGSYGWHGGALRHIRQIIEPLKWELVDSFEFVGSPTDKDLVKAEKFGEKFAGMIKAGR